MTDATRMKELKEYAHLYLGCKAILTNEDGEQKNFILNAYNLNYYRDYLSDIKLILRPLESMTEKERMDFYEKYFGKRMANDYSGDNGSAYFNPKSVIPTTDHIMRIVCGDDYRSGDFMKVVEMVPWLLSKGFDLFGLKEAGLAVYETQKV